jgi:LysM repeat protein
LFAAVALVAYLVQPGDTLSGIAASHGASLAAVEAANPSLGSPNLIFAGQTIDLPGGSSAAQSSAAQGSTATQSSTAQASSAQASGSQNTASTYRSPSGTAGTATQSSSTGSSSSSSGSPGYSTSSLSDIPGVPSSFASCVAYRESTNLQNPAANGNAYGIIAASGYNVSGSSLASQKQVFAKLYQQYGTSPWASDGC